MKALRMWHSGPHKAVCNKHEKPYHFWYVARNFAYDYDPPECPKCAENRVYNTFDGKPPKAMQEGVA
jgi:NAD-dependent SIR2 family protein deacetylase